MLSIKNPFKVNIPETEDLLIKPYLPNTKEYLTSFSFAYKLKEVKELTKNKIIKRLLINYEKRFFKSKELITHYKDAIYCNDEMNVKGLTGEVNVFMIEYKNNKAMKREEKKIMKELREFATKKRTPKFVKRDFKEYKKYFHCIAKDIIKELKIT